MGMTSKPAWATEAVGSPRRKKVTRWPRRRRASARAVMGSR
ncbi:hypothetical protein [Tautonia plasticadhaerens]|nr:hypothetical protein [Tautonia plasticadhaerens]